MDGNQTIQVLDSMEATGTALKAADDLLNEVDREKQAAAAQIPAAVEALKQAHLIEDHEADFAAEKLASHDGAVAVVNNLISQIGEDRAAFQQKLAASGQGSPLSEKEAGVAAPGATAPGVVKTASNSSPVVGRRSGLGEVRDSDRAFINGLGLGGVIPQ